MSSSPYGLHTHHHKSAAIIGICRVSTSFSDTTNATVVDLGLVGF